MIRPLKIFGMGLVFLSLSLGVCQGGRAEEKYTIRPGDTLYGISKSFGVSLEALKKANALERNSIHPKQVLAIPTRREKDEDEESRTPSTLPSEKDSSACIRRALGETDSYVVQKGDSLFSISAKAGLPIEEIKKINRLHTSTLKIGQILILPKERSRLDGMAEEPADGEEILGPSEREEGSVASTALGKWSNLEERSLLVRVVKTFLGVPYKLGGSTLKGIDCSAFVKKIYEVFNIQLPRTTREQFSIGKKVEKNQLEEGDLVFFRESGNRAHVGIYVGENQFVHASSYSKEVKIDYLDTPYYSKRFLRGVRVKELEREI
jgi:LysM repeat protein